MKEEPSGKSVLESNEFVRKVLTAVAIVLITWIVFFVLVHAADVFLLIFASILVGIFLRGIGKWLSHRSGLPIRFCSVAAVLVFFALISVLVVASAPTISAQIDQLYEKLPQSIENTKNYFMGFDLFRQAVERLHLDNLMPNAQVLLGKSAPFATSMLGAVGSFILVIILGVYFSVHPQSYVDGFIRLFPVHKRDRIRFILGQVETKLRWWIVGQFISMVTIGILTTIGLMAMGVPLALLLGLIAAFLTFIPNLGPILGAIPAVLFGFIESPQKAVWVIVLYASIQTVETYLITPFIQNKTIRLPPALIIVSQIIFGLLLGFVGLMLATPLTAAALVLIQYFYIEDILKDYPLSKKSKDHEQKKG